MPSARRKRSLNKKYYIQNINELKTKAKANYRADPTKKRLLLKLPLILAIVLTLRKRRLPLKLSTVLTTQKRCCF